MMRIPGLWIFLAIMGPAMTGFADTSIHCPDPTQIKYIAIPSSVNGFYTAESDGVGFVGMDIGVLQPSSMTLAVAAVSSVNDYWSFYCVYHSNGLVLSMATDNSKVYQQCHFADGSQRCEGSREECVLSCPEAP